MILCVISVTTFSNIIAFLCLVYSAVEDGHNDDENSYDVLRQAVKEYWITMKEYYKAVSCLICKKKLEDT